MMLPANRMQLPGGGSLRVVIVEPLNHERMSNVMLMSNFPCCEIAAPAECLLNSSKSSP